MSTIIDEGIDDILRKLLEDATGPALIVDPTPELIESLIDTSIIMTSPPAVNLLAEKPILKEAISDFLIASNAADLIAADKLSLRTAATDPGNELFLTENQLAAFITAAGKTAALTAENSDFGTTVYAYYTEIWNNAEPFRLRTPPRSKIQETLRTTISPEVEADFNAVLESLETVRGDGDSLDEVTISLLVAAKNQELLYDISKWGEDVGIASKATFSRTKTTLEELGLIDTEKVPIDVGRPRLRLKFAHDQLKNTTADELASVAQSILA